MTFEPTIRFEYRFSTSNAASMVVVTLGVTLGIGYIAYTKPNYGLVKLLSTYLSSDVAALFFWALTAACLCATIFAILFALRSRGAAPFIELGPQAVLLPNGTLSMSQMAVPYDTIQSIQISEIQGQQILAIKSPKGEVRLISKFFSSSSDFSNFLTTLEHRRRNF